MADSLYRSYSLDKSSEGTSGSLTFYEDSPYSPFDIGDTFTPIPGGPLLNVDKVNIKDVVIGEKFGKVLRQWQINIEGSTDATTSPDTGSNQIKYNFTINSDEKSGSMEVVNKGKAPALTIRIGDKFNIPGIGQVTCNQVKGNDSYDDYGTHLWSVTYEGSSKAAISGETDNLKYSFSVEKNSDGVITYSGTIESSNTGDKPSASVSVGDEFTLPYVGKVKCVKVSGSDDYEDGVRKWNVTCEGSRTVGSSGEDSGDDSSMPDDEYSVNYEINGTTARTVAGEFVALMRSETPITRKTYTIYNDSVNTLAAPGTTYEGGICTSEAISKEIIKSNGVVTKTYYKHVIEVES